MNDDSKPFFGTIPLADIAFILMSTDSEVHYVSVILESNLKRAKSGFNIPKRTKGL